MRRITMVALLTYCILSTLYIYSVEEHLAYSTESMRITDKMNGKIYSRLYDIEMKINQ